MLAHLLSLADDLSFDDLFCKDRGLFLYLHEYPLSLQNKKTV